MSYKAQGMHAAKTGTQCARVKLPTVRTILPKGRKQFTRMMDAWDMVKPDDMVAIPDHQESRLTPRISRKQRISPLTRIAEQLPAKLPKLY